jgi:glycosyltransferase involved in cell wall biosynthesis
MRVCMLAYSFYESDMRIIRYAKALVEQGDIVDVIALRRSGTPAQEMLDGVSVYRIQSRERNERSWVDYLLRVVRFMFAACWVLLKRHRADPYDVVHVHSVPDCLVFSAVGPKLGGAKIILDIHDILPEFFTSKFGTGQDTFLFRLLLLVEKLSVRFSDHVIIANDLWRERLLSRATTLDGCTVIINYPDTEVFRHRDKPVDAGSSFRITYPGTLNAHQGVDVAIRAISLIKNDIWSPEFHIYGEGPAKCALIELTEQLGVSDRVIFHEFLPCKEIADVMALSDVAVVPKRASSKFGNEAMSTKIMEFMSLGVPVVVSRTKVDTYYHDESRVLFFESENPAELADAICLIKTDDRLRQRLVSNASSYIATHTWDEKKKIYLKLIDRLCAQATQD